VDHLFSFFYLLSSPFYGPHNEVNKLDVLPSWPAGQALGWLPRGRRCESHRVDICDECV